MSFHHHGVCDGCGGMIPCGADHVRKWSQPGECPGHMTDDGLCGALISSRPRKRPIKGQTQREEACSTMTHDWTCECSGCPDHDGIGICGNHINVFMVPPDSPSPSCFLGLCYACSQHAKTRGYTEDTREGCWL